ncbi:unnamed protein product [Closterium sp. NIES-65]|nr:unnamed protein product [Closterium sp. NIES-65]
MTMVISLFSQGPSVTPFGLSLSPSSLTPHSPLSLCYFWYRISLSEGAVSVADPPPSSTPPDAVSSADGAAGASNEASSLFLPSPPSFTFFPLIPFPPLNSPLLSFPPLNSPLLPSPPLSSPLLPFPPISTHLLSPPPLPPIRLWQFPVHITGWASSTLAIVMFGSIFDEDPKQWRFVADLIGSSGAIFELATPLAPTHFLLLASLGNLTKAVAKGLKDPSARVIQTHFALQANVGEVVAKEEVYKVMAQLVGLGCGVLLLSSPYIAESYWSLVTTWAVIRSTHLAFRFKSLSVLEFDSVSCGCVSEGERGESYWSLVTTWAVIRSTHLAFRFKSLSVLEFDSVSCGCVSEGERGESYWSLVTTWAVIRSTHLAFRFKSLSVFEFDSVSSVCPEGRAALCATSQLTGASAFVFPTSLTDRPLSPLYFPSAELQAHSHPCQNAYLRSCRAALRASSQPKGALPASPPPHVHSHPSTLHLPPSNLQLNFKRMAILARAHVSGATELPSVQAVNQKERLWLPRRLTTPRINLGCSLADLSVLLEQQSANRMPITELLALYRDEQHVLLMDDTGAFSVIFKQGASKGTVLRVVWQACWLQQQRRERRREHGADGEEVHSDLADRSGASRSGGVGNSSSSSGGIGILQESLNALGSEFEGFLGKASTAGWDTNTLVAKVPPSAPLLMLEYEGFLAQETAAGWDTNTLLAKVPPSAPLLML